MATVANEFATLDEGVLPILVVRKNGKTIAVVRDNSLQGTFLPFYLPTCETLHVSRTEELQEARESGVLNVAAVEWPVVAKLRMALGILKEERYWLLFSRGGVSNEGLTSHMFKGDEEGVHDAVSWLSGFQLSGPCDILLASEPSVTNGPANGDVGRLRLKKEDEDVNERVVFGESATDVARYIGDLLRAHLFQNVTAPTAVFWPPQLVHPVNIHYGMANRRVLEHDALLLPILSLFRVEKRLKNWDAVKGLQVSAGCDMPRTGQAWEKHLVRNIHKSLKEYIPVSGGEVYITSGSYDYYHYLIDGFKDSGWGCAYRSLQTILSWFQYEGLMQGAIPSIHTIQEILSVKDTDKMNRKGFVGSKDWIGSFEIMIVLQHYIPGLDCTIRRMESGAELETNPEIQALLAEHFRGKRSCPVMIGGSSYAHTILGVDMNLATTEARYLIADPHYASNETSTKTVVSKGYVGWKEARNFFEANSWYNLCIPQVATFDPR
ncbi:hypothetical protein, conserved [Trypanosoma brucei brucei TREU927]|uniref:UFSP1/2/DUB catalytic domain-containing protein n=1 Tax=Trypanosoma brucei brucei (strain 927/4 GUTat10.1) TaxID=185431 RepID=Q580A1_TRYB2|nr:hypothetical protein, conserved [Trypanosoma brucei brucei TREU927]AAX80945.1 hypothetical protein, conserved [Trypanosoma brucei]AAZ10664.1 hypothetical protein, conserved [Trypanosoma brucei brucei TREU927]